MSLEERLAHQLEIPTPMPPAKAAVVLEHFAYTLRHRGFLFESEQALLRRVAQALTTEPDDTHCAVCNEPLSEFGDCALCRPRYH